MCFCLCFSILSRRCPLLATFLSVLFCLLSLLISDSRFDLVWFRLSCDHGWTRSGSVHVRKTTTTLPFMVSFVVRVCLTLDLERFQDRNEICLLLVLLFSITVPTQFNTRTEMLLGGWLHTLHKEQPIMRIEDRLFDRGWVRSAMATRKCGNIYFRKYFMAVRKFTNIFVLLLILMVGSRDTLFLVCFT